MARRLDPFLLNFLDCVEQELACALEARHRAGDVGPEDESVTARSQSERIATLRNDIDALQVALERGESPIVH